MSILILDAARTSVESQIDKLITTAFEKYIWQYTAIPDHLFLTNPHMATHTAIVLIEKGYLNNPTANLEEEHIRFAIYHPTLDEPLTFETDLLFQNVTYSSGVDSKLQQLDELASHSRVHVDDWIKAIHQELPPYFPVESDRAAELTRRYTIKSQALFLH